MSTWDLLIIGALGYCALDWILGMIYGRCVLPGLRCTACGGKGLLR